MTAEKCRFCGAELIDTRGIVRGRPRSYCNPRCRRRSERRVRHERVLLAWAQKIAGLPPVLVSAYERLYGAEQTRRWQAHAQTILAARQNGEQAREASH
jgi:hypothetical protein